MCLWSVFSLSFLVSLPNVFSCFLHTMTIFSTESNVFFFFLFLFFLFSLCNEHVSGTRTEEAFEEAERSSTLAAGQAGGPVGSSSLVGSSQAARVSAPRHLAAQPPQIRLFSCRGPGHSHAASRHRRQQGPHRHQLSCRIHGRHQHPQDERVLSPSL